MTMPPHPFSPPSASTPPPEDPRPQLRVPGGKPDRRRLIIIVAVAVVLIVLAVLFQDRLHQSPPAKPAPQALDDKYNSWLASTRKCPPGKSASGREREMRCLINYVRTRHQRRALQTSSKLNRSARLKARRVIVCNALSHRPCGDDALVSFQRAGYLGGAYEVSENVAYDTRSQPDARQTLLIWLNSREQRHEILTRSWREQGVALAHGRFHGDQSNIWVSQFGHH